MKPYQNKFCTVLILEEISWIHTFIQWSHGFGLIWCCYCMLQLSRNNQAMIKTSSSVHDSMFKKYFLKRVLWIKWLVIITFWMKYLWRFCNFSSPHVSCIEGNVSDFPDPQAHRSRGALGLGMEWLQRRRGGGGYLSYLRLNHYNTRVNARQKSEEVDTIAWKT